MVKKDFIARLYVILQYMQQTIKEKCPREELNLQPFP